MTETELIHEGWSAAKLHKARQRIAKACDQTLVCPKGVEGRHDWRWSEDEITLRRQCVKCGQGFGYRKESE